jgi:hypothetical protein
MQSKNDEYHEIEKKKVDYDEVLVNIEEKKKHFFILFHWWMSHSMYK